MILSRREAAPLLCLGCGLLLVGVSEQTTLLLAGLALYLIGALSWYQLSQPRSYGKRKYAWPLWLYESRPFAMILLGLLMVRELTHSLFLLPALFWLLLGAYQLWLRHQHRFWHRRAPALRPF